MTALSCHTEPIRPLVAAGSALAGLPATAGLSAGAGEPVAELNTSVPSLVSVSVSWLLAIAYDSAVLSICV